MLTLDRLIADWVDNPHDLVHPNIIADWIQEYEDLTSHNKKLCSVLRQTHNCVSVFNYDICNTCDVCRWDYTQNTYIVIKEVSKSLISTTFNTRGFWFWSKRGWLQVLNNQKPCDFDLLTHELANIENVQYKFHNGGYLSGSRDLTPLSNNKRVELLLREFRDLGIIF